MVEHDVARLAEPEGRQLREHFALVGDARAEHVVKGRYPIGGDDQERGGIVGERIDIADFSLAVTGQPVKRRLKNRRQWQLGTSSTKEGIQRRSSYRPRLYLASERGTTTNAFLAFQITPLIVGTSCRHADTRPNVRHRARVLRTAVALSSRRAPRRGLERDQAGEWTVASRRHHRDGYEDGVSCCPLAVLA